MRYYKLTLSEDQLWVITKGLEDISRFASGQCEMQHTIDSILAGLPFNEKIRRRDDALRHLNEIKKILLPELNVNESLGYNGSDFIGNTYQIYRSILHQFAKDNNWNNVYSSPTLLSGNLGSVTIEIVEPNK